MFSAQNIDDTFPTTSIFSQLFLSPKIHLDKMCAFQMSRVLMETSRKMVSTLLESETCFHVPYIMYYNQFIIF